MMYYSRLVGEWPLHIFLVWQNVSKFSKLSSLLITFILLAGDPNRQRPRGKPKVLPPDLVVVESSDL